MRSKYQVQDGDVAPKVAEYWVEIDYETKNPTGNICWAYFAEDRPAQGFWIKVRELQGVNNQYEDIDPACNRGDENSIEEEQ
jgi:hypothetical protein